MTLICSDICRDLLPPKEYFEYGLWMPADTYREESDHEIEPELSGEYPSREASPPPPPPPPAANEVVNLMKEVTGGASTATPVQAADVVRKLGMAPSQEDVAALQKRKGDSITAQDITAWRDELHAKHAGDSVDSLITFFRYYDKTGTGTLSKKQIKNLLKSFGEPLSDSEVESILTELQLNNDRIDYRKLAEGLLE